MSHHGKEPAPIPDAFRKIFQKPAPHPDPLHEAARKSRGEFPEGRLNEHDEGEMPMEVGHQPGKVIIRFPEAVTWIGMTGDGAMELAQCLIDHARQAGITKPIELKL